MMADEYIRRSDALRGVELFQCGWAEIEAVQADYIERLPAADVAPVVRCKDCECARDLGFQFGSLLHESLFCIYNGPHPTGANDFCSHGQKREEGEIEDDP